MGIKTRENPITPRAIGLSITILAMCPNSCIIGQKVILQIKILQNYT
jgi:hypothetical protein